MNNFQTNIQENIKVPESVQQFGQNVGNSINEMKTNVSSGFNEFSTQASAGVGASSQFLQSNTIIAKFVFLILVIIGFLFLLNLGVSALLYFLNPSASPYIVKGLITGQTAKTFSQDPTQGSNKKIVKLSNNRLTGIEFTWSVWIYISDLGSDSNKYQFIFNKGDTNFGPNNISQVNNAPGLYLSPVVSGNQSINGNTAKILVLMDTSDLNSTNNSIEIDKIPIRKWVNIIIRLENTMVDVYINGIVSGRLNLPLVPKQNFNDINVCKGGGFSGNLSDLRYFNYALNIVEINSINYWGPNLKASDENEGANVTSDSNYLSSLWYSEKIY